METNLKIENILKVFDGEFKPEKKPCKNTGRSSDAFVCYLYGEVKYKFGDYSLTASPQKLLYMAKGSMYEIQPKQKSKFICIDFNFSELSYLQKSQAFKCNASNIKNQFQKIYHIWRDKRSNYFPQMFSSIYNIYAEAVQSENKLYSKNNILMSEITAYILDYYTDTNFGVHNISTNFGISEVHLRRLFNQTLCTSPIKYINNLKLDRAKNMLEISNYSIAEIAQSSGFSDQYYFSRFFKMQTGVSPSEYRTSVASAF